MSRTGARGAFGPHATSDRVRGFTLIEVVIALAILAIALAATGRATHGSADSSATLKTKLLATWVAQNRLAELQLADKRPEKGERTGEAEQGGLRFQWKENITQTKNESILRLEISVSAASVPDYAAAKLVGYWTNLPVASASVPNPSNPNPVNPPPSAPGEEQPPPAPDSGPVTEEPPPPGEGPPQEPPPEPPPEQDTNQ